MPRISPERALQWRVYLRRIVRYWQFADESGDRVFINHKMLADMVKVTQPTFTGWWSGKQIPFQSTCPNIASAFDVPLAEVMEAAGYPVTDVYEQANLHSLYERIAMNSTIPNEDRLYFLEYVGKASDPNWQRGNSQEFQIVQSILGRVMSDVEKAQYISTVVEAAEKLQRNR